MEFEIILVGICIWFAMKYYGKCVLWIVPAGGCFALAFASHDYFWIFFSVLSCICFVVHLSIALGQQADNSAKKTQDSRNKREKRIEREYGIIDFSEK